MSKRSKKKHIFISILLLLCLLFSAGFGASPVHAGEQAEETSSEAAAEAPSASEIDELPELDSFEMLPENTTDAILQGEGYSAVLYNNMNGLPTSEANAIVESKEGFIWIGSYSGLIRYDGDTFTRLSIESGIANVTSLYIDSKDQMWVGTNDNGVVLITNGQSSETVIQDGLKSSSIRAITEDEDGIIYIAATGGLAMVDEDRNLFYSGEPQVDEANMKDLQKGSDGLIYGLTEAGDIFTMKNGSLVSYVDHENCTVSGVNCIYPDPETPGKLYMGTSYSVVYYGDPAGRFEELKGIDIYPLSNVEQFCSLEGQLWICANNGIGILKEEGLYKLENLPMNNSVGRVMMDYEGNLWFTSTRQGVMKIVRNPFLEIYDRLEIPDAVVNATRIYEDRLFVGTDTGLTVIGADGVESSFPVKKFVTASGYNLGKADLIELLSDCRIRSLIKDRKGRLWISTWRAFGLLCYDKGTLTMYSEPDGLLSDGIRVVYERKDGSLLVAQTGGVCVIENDQVTASYSEKDGLTNTEILTVNEGPNGELLLGSDGGGLFIIDGDGVRHLGREDGLWSDVILRIKKDPLRDLYWIVTSNSLAYMTPDYEVTTIQQFPYSNNFDLFENQKGDMWVISSNGIYVVPVEDLLANGEITADYYGVDNGMPCMATANSYSTLTKEGYLYIAGTTGVARVNIETTAEYLRNLKMAVPYVETDGEMVYPDEKGDFTIGADVKKLTIHSFVFNYSLCNPQVSYHLEGLEQKEETVRRDQLSPVTYTNLRGGTYQFVMELHDPMERERNTLSVTIVKAKALYEYVWFDILCFLAFIFCIWLILRWNMRRRMRYLEKKHREEAEKERIGSELQMGARIQRSMLPPDDSAYLGKPEFDICASMKPAKEVGGDFYDYFLIDDDHLGIVMADVSGKGVPASLFMMISKTILQSCAMLGKSAEETLTKTNEALCSNNTTEMFVTAWFGILELRTGIITAANAGHEYPVIKNKDRFELLKDKHGLVIGGMDCTAYHEYTFQLKPKDKLFLYTDGLAEAMNEEETLFGTDRMLDALNRDPEGSPRQILETVKSAVDEFVGNAEQFDDLTMLCLEYRGTEERSINAVPEQ